VFDYLMASLNLVIQERPDALAICIAPWTKVHFDKINKLGLSNHILCPGVQSHDKISLYLGAADALLLPRMKNGSEMFNFPGRLGDYLAAGRPIVSTANGDENERIMRMFNCGLLAEPDSPASYSEKILQLLDDPKLRREIGENNRKTATDKLSWAIIGQDLADSVLRK
jgi:glycosyltransferase involved in cell wall biosynthesis